MATSGSSTRVASSTRSSEIQPKTQSQVDQKDERKKKPKTADPPANKHGEEARQAYQQASSSQVAASLASRGRQAEQNVQYSSGSGL